VFYSFHCYSKEAKGDEAVHFEESKKYGVEKRTFCKDRWRFSKKLPSLIQEMQSKMCFSGGSQEVLYRLEEQDPRNRVCGWYICLRLNFRLNKTPQLELSIRSVHYRTNKPHSIRGSGQRFYVLVAKLLNKHK